MITVGMNYEVLKDKERAFEAVFQAVIKALENVPGHRKSHLFRDVFNRQQYLIISDWNDRAAFDAFIASDQFRSVTDWGKDKVLAGRPTHEYYER